MAQITVTIEEFIDRDGDRIGQFDLHENSKITYDLTIQDAQNGKSLVSDKDSALWGELRQLEFNFNSDNLSGNMINVFLKVTAIKHSSQQTSNSGDVMNRTEEYITISPSNSYYLDLCNQLNLDVQSNIDIDRLLEKNANGGSINLKIISLRLASKDVTVSKPIGDLRDETELIKNKIALLQLDLEALQTAASNYSVQTAEGQILNEVERDFYNQISRDKRVSTDLLTKILAVYTSLDQKGSLNTSGTSKYIFLKNIQVNLTKLTSLLASENKSGGVIAIPK